MYDTLSSEYDYFVNWPARLAGELPFIQQNLATLQAQAGQPLSILDAACGTGMHAIALAKLGHSVSGADLSAPMVQQARANAIQAGLALRFEPAGFGDLASTFGRGRFDALLCLGNSLPHVLTPDGLISALRDFAACLRPGGLLLVQNRNFDQVLASQERWMEPQSHQQAGVERIFLRFYDFDPDGLLTFTMLLLKREGAGAWQQQVTSTRLRPLLHTDLAQALSAAGFTAQQAYGSLAGTSFDPAASGNLVITAQIKNGT